MASILTAFYARSVASTTVTDNIGTRLYPDQAPETASTPYAVYSEISRTHEHSMAGASGLARSRIQVDCFATTRALADTAGEGFRELWDGWRGTTGTVNVRSCMIDDESTDYVAPVDANETGMYVRRIDFIVWYVESVPSLS